jgi:hypothetical protein
MVLLDVRRFSVLGAFRRQATDMVFHHFTERVPTISPTVHRALSLVYRRVLAELKRKQPPLVNGINPWSLPRARPISCNDSPAFQRRQMSVFCAAESPYRLPDLTNTTSKNKYLYQMVLHRPVELATRFR